MRKLKSWESFTCLFSYPVGICVLIYRYGKKEASSSGKAEEAPAHGAPRSGSGKPPGRPGAPGTEEARRASLDRRIYRVVGVTFDNDDGPARNRQEILREIAAEEPHPRAFSLEVYDFEGEPAVGVFYNGEQVGNIAKKDLPGVLPLMDRYAGLSDFAVTGGGDKCGLEIAVYFKKSA